MFHVSVFIWGLPGYIYPLAISFSSKLPKAISRMLTEALAVFIWCYLYGAYLTVGKAFKVSPRSFFFVFFILF
jgi:hypothetical protein